MPLVAPGSGDRAAVDPVVEHRPGRRRSTQWLGIAVAAVPVISMAGFVRRASPMPWNDYWDILPRATNPDGSFAPLGALSFQNEHPVAIPSLIYWLNERLTGGLNNTLGLYVLVVALATVVVLVRSLPWPIGQHRWEKAAFTVLIAFLVFSTRGIHNFVLAMSGTAWLTANALACTAFFVAWRRSPYVALPLAAAAALSYGTGLVSFPVLVLIAVLQRRPRAVVATTGAATVVAIGLYLVRFEQPGWIPGEGRTIVEIIRRSSQVLGSPFIDDIELAGAIGVGVACLAVVGLSRAARERRLLELAPWIALIAYAVGGSLLIGWSRGGLTAGVGVSSRYVSLGALMWIGTLVLLAATFRRPILVSLPVIGLVSLGAFVAGQTTVTEIVDTRYYSDQLAIVLRLGAETSPTDRFFSNSAIPTMRQLDHYPFNQDFDLDCGLLGERLDVPALGRPAPLDGPAGVQGAVQAFGPAVYSSATGVQGWIASSMGAPRCVVLIDRSGVVIGAMVRGRPSPERELGFDGAEMLAGAARTQRSGGSYRAVAVFEDRRVLLDNALPAP